MDPQKYLQERVAKVDPESDKIYNTGCTIIANYPAWEYALDDILEIAWDTLVLYCTRNRDATYNSAAKLTFASMMVGQKLSTYLGNEAPSIKDSLGLGDLMIEVYLQDGKVVVERAYDDYKAPYTVRIVDINSLEKPKLVGTTLAKPEDITYYKSPITGESFIKGWKEGAEFNALLNKPFIKALNLLRKQGWIINEKVLHAALKSPPPTELITEDGEILKAGNSRDVRALKLASKLYEYQQVTSKASLLVNKTFYQEVSCDYRGRVYYAESFLSYQGGDLARSLMMFDEKKEVTDRGYYWLCIKAACSYNQSYPIDDLPAWITTDYKTYLESEGMDTISVDKMTLNDRYYWTQNNLDLIRNTTLISFKAEKPYSFYATCLEIIGYLRARLENRKYYSNMPVSVDG